MDIKKNDNIKLNIESLTSQGSAVGHFNGEAVFVRSAAPGDEISAHIIKTSKRYAVGIVNEIIKPSPSRIEVDCPVFQSCGGCSFRHITYDEELRFKQQRVADALSRLGHIDAPVRDIIGCDSIYNYRNKAQYPVSIENGVLTAGFYAYKSHRIVPCTSCALQSDDFKNCIEAFSKWVSLCGISSYNESSGKGLLRHIYLRKGFASGEIMACAVINGDSVPASEVLIKNLKKVKGVKSICFNVNKEKSNVILGRKTKALWGSKTIEDVILGKRFVISPASFYQVNRSQCEKLYKKAYEYAALTGNEVLLDLYCGIGTIGISMANGAKKVYGVEVVPEAIENAELNARINGVENAEFMCADAYKAAADLEKRGVCPDVIVLDPPRKGCNKELFTAIDKMSPERIVYVSCDCATLARDLDILSQYGYVTREVTPVDMFARTPHVEAVALVERKNKTAISQ